MQRYVKPIKLKIMEEIWKKIEGYDGDYLISNLGRVKSYYNNKESILKQSIDRRGYYRVSLSKNSIKKTFSIHRLVSTAFIENKDNKLTVNHLDGIKTNNQVTNLQWATNSENIQHAFKTGLMENSKKNIIKAYEASKKPVYSEKLVMQFESIRSASIYVKEHYFNNSTVGSISSTITDLIAGRKQTSMYDYGWEIIND